MSHIDHMLNNSSEGMQNSQITGILDILHYLSVVRGCEVYKYPL